MLLKVCNTASEGFRCTHTWISCIYMSYELPLESVLMIGEYETSEGSSCVCVGVGCGGGIRSSYEVELEVS